MGACRSTDYILAGSTPETGLLGRNVTNMMFPANGYWNNTYISQVLNSDLITVGGRGQPRRGHCSDGHPTSSGLVEVLQYFQPRSCIVRVHLQQLDAR